MSVSIPTFENDLVCERQSTVVDESFASKAVNTARMVRRTIHNGNVSQSLLGDYRPEFCDDDGVVCIDWSDRLSVHRTTNGSEYNELFADSHPDFASYKAALLAESVPQMMRFLSLYKDSQGAWFVCVGTQAEYQTEPVAKIFRSTDGGTTWTDVLSMTYGYVLQWGWQACEGGDGYMVLAEYGWKNAGQEQARKVYMSTDYGLTWQAIHAFDVDATYDMHSHTAIFDPTDAGHQTIYVTRGDAGYSRGVYKLTYGSPQWSAALVAPLLQHTAMIAHNNYIYMGSDFKEAGPTVCRLDPADDSVTSIFEMPAVVASAAAGYSGYNPRIGWGYAFNFRRFDDMFVMGVRCPTDSDDYYCGLYVSADMEQWTPVQRLMQTNTEYGIQSIAGVYGGYIWTGYSDGGTNYGAQFTRPVVSAVDVQLSAPAMINHIDNDIVTGDWSLETGSGSIAAGGDYSDNARSTDHALAGTYSYKFTRTSGGSGYAQLNLPRIADDLGHRPMSGEFITLGCWVKVTDWSLGYDMSINVYALGTGSPAQGIDYDRIVMDGDDAHMMDGWERIECTVKILQDFDADAAVDDLQFRLFITQTYAADATIYIDGLYCYISSIGPSSLFPLVSGSVSAETPVFSMAGAGNEWTLTFDWFPVTGEHNIQGSWLLPIGYIEAVNGTYMYLYWKASDGKFYATDGSQTISSTETWSPQFYDLVKVGIVADTTGITVYIDDAVNGSFTFNGAVNLTSQPLFFGAGRSNNLYGLGAFANVRAWNEKLNAGSVAVAFGAIGNLIQNNRFVDNVYGVHGVY